MSSKPQKKRDGNKGIIERKEKRRERRKPKNSWPETIEPRKRIMMCRRADVHGCRKTRLHDLVLGEARWVILLAFHHVVMGDVGGHILDESDSEGTTTVLVAGELGCLGVRIWAVSAGYESTYKWLSLLCLRYRIGRRQYHGSGRWARTGSQHARPCQWWRTDQSGHRCR